MGHGSSTGTRWAKTARWTVFDAGVPGFWPQLEQNGISPSAVEAVVLTHAHADHVGVADKLREAGARVYVHEADEGLAKTGKASWKNERSPLPYLRYGMAWKLLGHLARNGALKPNKIADAPARRSSARGRPVQASRDAAAASARRAGRGCR